MSNINENDFTIDADRGEDFEHTTTITVRTSKNNVNLNQIRIACRHVLELLEANVTENLAIRTLELFVDVYGKLYHGGSATPHHVNQVRLWSVAARQQQQQFPNKPPKDYLRVEHGTPKRALARLVLNVYQQKGLDQTTLDDLINQYWKLAVITLEEDERLARSKMFETPEARWDAAKIEFPTIAL